MYLLISENFEVLSRVHGFRWFNRNSLMYNDRNKTRWGREFVLFDFCSEFSLYNIALCHAFLFQLEKKLKSGCKRIIFSYECSRKDATEQERNGDSVHRMKSHRCPKIVLYSKFQLHGERTLLRDENSMNCSNAILVSIGNRFSFPLILSTTVRLCPSNNQSILETTSNQSPIEKSDVRHWNLKEEKSP